MNEQPVATPDLTTAKCRCGSELTTDRLIYEEWPGGALICAACANSPDRATRYTILAPWIGPTAGTSLAAKAWRLGKRFVEVPLVSQLEQLILRHVGILPTVSMVHGPIEDGRLMPVEARPAFEVTNTFEAHDAYGCVVTATVGEQHWGLAATLKRSDATEGDIAYLRALILEGMISNAVRRAFGHTTCDCAKKGERTVARIYPPCAAGWYHVGREGKPAPWEVPPDTRPIAVNPISPAA